MRQYKAGQIDVYFDVCVVGACDIITVIARDAYINIHQGLISVDGPPTSVAMQIPTIFPTISEAIVILI